MLRWIAWTRASTRLKRSSHQHCRFHIAARSRLCGRAFRGQVFRRSSATIDGTWSQGSASLPLLFHRQTAGTAAPQAHGSCLSRSKASGKARWKRTGCGCVCNWHVSHDSETSLSRRGQSGPRRSGLPAINVLLKEAAFHLEIPSLAGAFEGTLDPAKQVEWELVANGRGSEARVCALPINRLELRRPQTPKKHILSRGRDFVLQCDSRSFAGRTLTASKRRWAFPASTAVVGSGRTTVMRLWPNPRPFLVLADT